jgi:orotate phosphoribosyltransferase
MKGFNQKLEACIERNGSHLCVGLDPDPEKMPRGYDARPRDLLAFNRSIIEATSDLVCAYKPNLAFYEAFGPKGIKALIQTVQEIPKHIPVILDAKRGDIGNTGRAYARAMFDALGGDAVTVNPLMGADSVEPFLEFTDKGVFVLALTSNPVGSHQSKRRAGGRRHPAGDAARDSLALPRPVVSRSRRGRAGGRPGCDGRSGPRASRGAPDHQRLARRDSRGAREQLRQGRAAQGQASAEGDRRVSDTDAILSGIDPEIRRILTDSGALLTGHFELTSGRRSAIYFQGMQLLRWPEHTAKSAKAVAAKIGDQPVDVCFAPAVGGIVWGYAMAQQFADCESIFAERVDGTMALRRNFTIEPGARLLLCEDVITTGGTVLELQALAEKTGAEIVGVACVLDRSGSSPGCLSSRGSISPSRRGRPRRPPPICAMCPPSNPGVGV